MPSKTYKRLRQGATTMLLGKFSPARKNRRVPGASRLRHSPRSGSLDQSHCLQWPFWLEEQGSRVD